MDSLVELLLERSGDPGPGLFEADRTWTHAEVLAEGATRAAWLRAHRRPGPFHVAVLLDNVAEYVFWLHGAALAGAVVVGGNTTHRGDELVRDLTHTECRFLVTSHANLSLLEGRTLDDSLGTVSATNPNVVVVDDPGAHETLAPYAGIAASEAAATDVGPDTLGHLLFTSGTSSAPKACRCTQGRLARISGAVAQMFALGPDDVCYVSMPLFHSNALMAGWGPALFGGSAVALPSAGRFSASGFLPDVRRFGATYFNYVGKPLAFVLATPERADDAENSLRRGFGNEGATEDVRRFSVRFGCAITDGYGSTEGGAVVSHTPDTPPGALGRAPEGTVVLDPTTGEECPPARFDADGRLVNAGEAIGELVSRTGGAGFEGYWRNEVAERMRVKEGWYWTGDLVYRDAAGFFFFAGRDHEWLRVDGENFAAGPVERIVERHPDVVAAAVYAVPDVVVGDQVMVALELRPDAEPFDPVGFAAFLAAQADLGTKWAPRFVRITAGLPVTATNKVVKRDLRTERWHTIDPVWWVPERDSAYVGLGAEDVTALDTALARAGVDRAI